MAIVLLMLLMSCQSTRYKVVVPALTFPDFPEAESIVENKADETCTVPSNWIVQLSLFKIRYEATAETYKMIKENVENEE